AGGIGRGTAGTTAGSSAGTSAGSSAGTNAASTAGPFGRRRRLPAAFPGRNVPGEAVPGNRGSLRASRRLLLEQRDVRLVHQDAAGRRGAAPARTCPAPVSAGKLRGYPRVGGTAGRRLWTGAQDLGGLRHYGKGR